MTVPKIFLFCEQCTKNPNGDVYAQAIAEDGTGLGGHLSSNKEWAKHDIGLTSNWHHDEYRKHYPGGYEVEWIDQENLSTHIGFQRAVYLNSLQNPPLVGDVPPSPDCYEEEPRTGL
jgi:hypothetical protein